MSQMSLLQKDAQQQNNEDDLVYTQDENTRKKEPTETQRMIAARFKLARELSGLTEANAVIRMGLRNPKVISQIENLHRLPTIHFVIRASNAYGVSADYLLGLSDDDDSSSGVATRAAIMRQNEKMVGMFANILSKTSYDYARTVGDGAIKQIVLANEALHLKFNRFCELNPQFLDMRGGAPVQELILTIVPLAKCIKKRLSDRDKLIELHNNQIEHLVQRQLEGV